MLSSFFEGVTGTMIYEDFLMKEEEKKSIFIETLKDFIDFKLEKNIDSTMIRDHTGELKELSR
jgi:hypothetical protein